MICYRDREFCIRSFPAEGKPRCVNDACGRCVSDKDIASARQRDLPFAVADYWGDECGYRETPQ